MRKLKTTIPDGGAPLLEFPTLKTLFDTENKDAIEVLLNSVVDGETQGVILKGCIATAGATAGNIDISSGYVYLDGEVLKYPGETDVASPRYIKKATVTEEGGEFADGVIKNYIEVHTAIGFTATTGGAGTQYIEVTSSKAGRSLSDITKNKLRTKIIDIGDWNMDLDATKQVTHGLADQTKIRTVDVIIRSDDNVVMQPLVSPNAGGIDDINATVINLFRESAGLFDGTFYDSTSFNRGWITIGYLE